MSLSVDLNGIVDQQFVPPLLECRNERNVTSTICLIILPSNEITRMPMCLLFYVMLNTGKVLPSISSSVYH